jgi:hypothetical protein
MSGAFSFWAEAYFEASRPLAATAFPEPFADATRVPRAESWVGDAAGDKQGEEEGGGVAAATADTFPSNEEMKVGGG